MIKVEQAPSLLSIKGINHGFFTRVGGASLPPFESLNCSLLVGDDEKAVRENRHRALSYLGLDKKPLIIPKIVHGKDVYVVKEGDDPEAISHLEADALISCSSSHVLGITYADCLPIAIAAKDASIIAIIHAGWRGLLAGVIDACVEKIEKTAGKKELVAAIGPALSPEGFHFGGDGLKNFQARWPECVGHDAEGTFVDLCAVAVAQLNNVGLLTTKVGGFTDENPDWYFSYRRDQGRSGRHVALIGIDL